MHSTVCAIILAAGTGSRMGKTKQLLPIGKHALLEHVIRGLLVEDFAEVVAVIGYDATRIKEKIVIDNDRFRWVENEDYLSGQSSSFKKGVDSLKGHHSHMMVFLGDLPFITTETLRFIHQAGVDRMEETNVPFMIRPTYNGIAGHPVFFGNMDRRLFAQLQGDTGGKGMMHQISDRIFLEVEDCGILFDVDTPAQYEEAKKMAKLLS